MNQVIEEFVTVLHGAWRFRWMAFLVSVLICVVGWVVVFGLVDRYRSNATVFVDTNSSLRPLLDDLTVAPDVMRQVDLVRQALGGRPQLERVARETGLYLRAGTTIETERLLARMNNDVSITTNPRRERNLFEISFIDQDPKMAQTVVQTLLNLFVEDSLGANKQGTQQAQKFLRDQLALLESELIKSEQELANFKKANVGRMPGETGSYFDRLQSEMTALENIEGDMRLAEKRKAALQDQLAGENTSLDGNAALQTEVDVQIAENRRRLADLQLRFTDMHPDVIALKSTIEQLEEQKKNELTQLSQSGVAGMVSDNPVFQSIQIELSKVNVEIATLSEKRSTSIRKIGELRGLIDILPEIEAELTRLTRDYDVKHSQYQALLQRLEVAELSESAEENENIRFKIIDPPSLPDKPSEPNRRLLLAIILLVGLGGGGAFSILANQLKPVFSDIRQTRRVLGLPVLGSVSVMETRERKIRRAGQISSFVFGISTLFVLFVVLVLFEDAGTEFIQRIFSGIRGI